MSSNDWAPGPEDVTAVRHPLPRTGEQEATPVPLPRVTDVDPYTGAPVEPVLPTAAAPSEPSWGSAPTAPTPPAPPRPAWTDPSATALRPSALQHAAPVPAAPLPPRKDDTRAVALGVMIAAIVLAAGGGGFYLTWSHSSTAPSSSTSSPTTDFSGSLPAGRSDSSSGTDSSASTDGGSVSNSTPETNSTPTTEPAPVDPDIAARQQLDALRNASVARLPLDGRWVAQVASKSVGITDPLQTAANGSHTFYATDILAESLRARSTVSNPDSNVYVVWSTDFGKRSQAPDGSPYWITLVDAGLGGSNAVKSWCQATYSYLTPAQLADTCVARQLTTPHS